MRAGLPKPPEGFCSVSSKLAFLGHSLARAVQASCIQLPVDYAGTSALGSSYTTYRQEQQECKGTLNRCHLWHCLELSSLAHQRPWHRQSPWGRMGLSIFLGTGSAGDGSGPTCGRDALLGRDAFLARQQKEVSRPCAIQEDEWEIDKIFTVTLQKHMLESYQHFREGWTTLNRAMVRNLQDGNNWKFGISHQKTTKPLLWLCFCYDRRGIGTTGIGHWKQVNKMMSHQGEHQNWLSISQECVWRKGRW